MSGPMTPDEIRAMNERVEQTDDGRAHVKPSEETAMSEPKLKTTKAIRAALRSWTTGEPGGAPSVCKLLDDFDLVRAQAAAMRIVLQEAQSHLRHSDDCRLHGAGCVCNVMDLDRRVILALAADAGRELLEERERDKKQMEMIRERVRTAISWLNATGLAALGPGAEGGG